MAIDLASVMQSALGLAFDSTTRLYRLEGEADIGQMLVEAWSLKEQLDRPFLLELYALSLDARVDIRALLGKTVTLQLALADGTLQPRSGIVFNVSSEDADGGFARYKLALRPWTQLLAHTRQSRVWQEKTTVEIIEDVFSRYSAHAQWRWADDVAAHLAQSPYAGSDQKRSYTVQYRETDLAFVQRMLAEEGLSMRIEEDGEDDDGAINGENGQASSNAKPPSPCRHSLVIFADSPSSSSCPEDLTSESGAGIRFHRESAVETSDAVQAFGGMRTLQAATTTVLAWDYVQKRSVAVSVPTNQTFGGSNVPRLEAYRPMRPYAFSNSTQAQRAATLGQEAIEVRNKTWLGRSTVRTLQAGTSFTLTGSPLDDLDWTGSGASNEEQTRFLTTAVIHAGINNLPKDVSEAVAQHAARSRSASGANLLAPWVDAEVREQATKTGYGNAFEATRAYVPWRPEPIARPKAPGPLIAEVVGPDGSTSGADEIHTDRLGRIKIRHDFQKPGEGSTWVRVMQPFAGSGHGIQFIPRIGQSVLIDFFWDDLERPYCKGALYNGKGEGGIPATTGGKAASADTSAFAQSTDHSPSAQGNLAGGNAPPWHAASPEDHSAGGQRNAGALSGWKTKEFKGAGFNQLVFDDSNGQLRTQLASTQYTSQLNLGHLIHQADNHRGSFRGLGFELRTDAYGTLRGGRGLLLSSFGITPATPSGDNAAGIALAAQLKTLSDTFSQAAKTHETVALAGAIGTTKANQSALSDKEASVSAMHTALKGMVAGGSFDEAAGDAGEKKTETGNSKVPQLTDPVVAISARAGLAITAGQDVAMLAGESLVMGAGQDLGVASGGAARIHTGQAIGILGGAIAKGSEAAGTGLTLIAGKGDIDVQAQSDKMQIAAKGDVLIQSKSSHIDWAAAKKITLVTKAGASIVIEGGNITVMCPGKISVKAAKKSFIGPAEASYSLPVMPRQELAPDKIDFALVLQDVPGQHGQAMPGREWKAVLLKSATTDVNQGVHHAVDARNWREVLASGVSGSSGECQLSDAQQKTIWQASRLHPEKVWLVSGAHAMPIGFASFTASEGEHEQRKTMDALNFVPDPDPRGDADPKRMLRAWVERDYDASLTSTPKSATET